MVSPRSRCPGCGTEITARDNIPVLSWLHPARPLPHVRRADLGALPARGAAHRCAVRRGDLVRPARRGSCRRTSTWRPSASRCRPSTSTPSGCPTRSCCRPTPWPSCCSCCPRRSTAGGTTTCARVLAGVALFAFYFLLCVHLPRGHGLRRREALRRARDLPGLGLLGAWSRWARSPPSCSGRSSASSCIARGKGGAQDQGPLRALHDDRHASWPCSSASRSSTGTPG